ncbi:Alpha-2-macroglobulin N-terminal [Trinorchestia longiramus]|nr:Alpha-2-macroglobulin N-terminal [Trinorchestia longiramus]
MAPSVLRPNRPFSVVVSSHNTNDTLKVALEISGNLNGDGTTQPNTFNTRQEAELIPDSTQLVKFQMGDLNHGDYHLSVSGSTATRPGVQFRNITTLKFEPKSYSVFVETDKAVYKPGDLVRFRVIVVSPNLRPSVTGAIDVHVEDGGGVTVRRFDRVFTNKGVFTDSIQLSTEPVLGHWSIVVIVLGQENRGTFYVAEFVPPKFEVKVGVPEHLSLEDQTVTVTIDANYPYGRPISGEVTLQVTPTYKYKYLQAPYDRPVSVVRSMKGTTEIELDMVEDLGLRGDYARVLEVTAYVKEALTGRVQNSSVAVTVFRFPYRMTFIRSSATFKPGLKYTAYVQLSYQDGRPVTSGELIVRHAFVRDDSAFIETRHQVPPTGLVTLSMYPPLERPGPSWTLALEATYGALTQWLGEVPRAHSPAGAFLQATLLTERPTVGKEVLVALNSTENIVYFVYEVIARGQILYATTLQAHQGTSHTFRFLASSAMFPRTRLVVYYVREDGEVVADSLHFTVARDAQEKVSLSVTPKDVDVSSSGRVAITVSAKPNSIIGVTSMDSRNLAILGDHHRLDDDDIMTELESYDPGLPWGSGGPRVGENQGLLRRARAKRSNEGALLDSEKIRQRKERSRRSLARDQHEQHSRQKRTNEEHEERFERTPKELKDESYSAPGKRTTRHKRTNEEHDERFEKTPKEQQEKSEIGPGQRTTRHKRNFEESQSQAESSSMNFKEREAQREKRASRAEIAWYGTAAAHDIFQDAGVVIMTNANIPQDNPLSSGAFLPGEGPIDGRGWDPTDLPAAHNGPFGRLAEAYRPDTSTLRPDLGPGLEYHAPPRPALAGPYAFSYLPPPPDHKPRVYLSQLPPPTWLFTHRRTGLNGIITWQEDVPKAPLTSYTLTAFAIDDFEGLTMAESMSEVVTQRRFFVSVRIPPTVIRGEAVAVEMVVFNYGPSNVTATVTLHNDEGAFLFPDFSNEIEQASPASGKSRQIAVPSEGGDVYYSEA